METRKVTIKNKIGLHARPAALFVQTCSKYKSDVYIEKDGNRVNAKSIMGIMALGVAHGEEINIIVEGYDERKAIDDIVDLVENRLEKE
ncbi:HPr family phosphocarrier protein [Brassicibacter mesophilus]|uniref:HPr family phosphocarrier protein n=1 Tax=Brassicibacter mesophilus TaxID=745119 RepID=UPI003D1E01E2